MPSPKNAAADKKATFDSEIAKALNEMMMPGFAQTAARANWGLNGGIDKMVDAQFEKPERALEEGYTMAKGGTEAAIRQQLLQNGSPYSSNLIPDAITDANQQLMEQKHVADVNMELQKSEEKLKSFYALTNVLNKEGGMLLDLAKGSSANWGNAIGMLKNTNPWASAAAGAASGAAAGSVVPGWGTVIGGIVGGVGGYFGGR